MAEAVRRLALLAGDLGYRALARPLLFTQDAGRAHELALSMMRAFDARPALMHVLRRATLASAPVHVGGVALENPLILAAGMVKGMGFATEAEALAAVAAGEPIIPGWRGVPALLGAVEFGSFTRYPRLGNTGDVMWRHPASRSTQNRVGLKNPGAAAAAAYLGERPMPPVYGLNIAVSPGVDDPDQERDEVLEAAGHFLARGLRPAWLTLNVSCPNTDDDPGDHQTEARTRALCRALVAALHPTPLWVKISPDLADSQYRTLLRVFADEGVRAVVATNTLPHPAPGQPRVSAGLGGGALYAHALRVTALLSAEQRARSYPVAIIGCGGVMSGQHLRAYVEAGARAIQYWSALVYRGPLAAALILGEVCHAGNWPLMQGPQD